MKYSRILLSLLLLVSVIALGCAKEEDDPARADSTTIIAKQDKNNLLKYQFNVMYEGRVLTRKDATFMWNFGDGSRTSSRSTPIHDYTEEGERVVTVTFDIESENGKSERISKDIVVLVGKDLDVYSSVVTANSGPEDDLLYYTFISSSIPSAENGNQPLHYQWVITGPDENGNEKTHIYPEKGEKPITKNTLKHRFENFGKFYNIDLYIKPAKEKDFKSKPSATMYMRTVLPTIQLDCSSRGKIPNSTKEQISCKPIFNYDIKTKMTYNWTFYSVDSSDGSTIRDGEVTTTGAKPEAIFIYPDSGLKYITVEGTHPTNMDGIAEGNTKIQLNSQGILNPVKCERPVDHLGNFTDDSRLVYECVAEGFINKIGTNEPSPLTTYTWKISEEGKPISNDGFSWGTGDTVGGDDKVYTNNENVKTRVDCYNQEGICVATLKFTASKFGGKYDITLEAKQRSEHSNEVIYDLPKVKTRFYTEMPKITGIKRETDPKNPMKSTFTPQFDSSIPEHINLDSTWIIEGKEIGGPDKWHEKNANNKDYDGTQAPAIKDRKLTHSFSKSGDYSMQVKITSDSFSNSYLKPEPIDPEENTKPKIAAKVRAADNAEKIYMPAEPVNANSLKFELSQKIAGSYFDFSANRVTNQYTFFTDYEARVGGKPVSTTYVVTIYNGPMIDYRDNTVNEVKLVFKDKKEFETLKYNERNDSQNVKLLYNVSYKARLEVYNSAVYDANTSNPTGTLDATYKKIEKDNINTGTIDITEYHKGIMHNTWYQDFFAKIETELSGSKIGVDRSLFRCEWSFWGDDEGELRLGTSIPLHPEKDRKKLHSDDCSKTIWVYYFDKGGSKHGNNQNVKLTVTGPFNDKDQYGIFGRKEFQFSYKLEDPK